MSLFNSQKNKSLRKKSRHFNEELVAPQGIGCLRKKLPQFLENQDDHLTNLALEIFWASLRESAGNYVKDK